MAYPCVLLSPFLRTFSPAGKVYRGRWKGAIVAVKVIDHRVQPGKTYDLSREPLLSMSVSHPNVVITHKVGSMGGWHAVLSFVGQGRMQRQALLRTLGAAWLGALVLPAKPPACPHALQMCVVKVNPSLEQHLPEEEGLGDSGRSSSGGKLNSSGSGGAGKLVPAIDGSGSMVEIVSPHDILQPGLYETWLVSGVHGAELCACWAGGWGWGGEHAWPGLHSPAPCQPALWAPTLPCQRALPAAMPPSPRDLLIVCMAFPASSCVCQVCEFCDRGSLADLVATGKLSPDPAQRDIWAVLCLLDIALGLEYLHSNSLVRACGLACNAARGAAGDAPESQEAGLGAAAAQQASLWQCSCCPAANPPMPPLHSFCPAAIYAHLLQIHGDLKPANVMLKAARNDRRGFICKVRF